MLKKIRSAEEFRKLAENRVKSLLSCLGGRFNPKVFLFIIGEQKGVHDSCVSIIPYDHNNKYIMLHEARIVRCLARCWAEYETVEYPFDRLDKLVKTLLAKEDADNKIKSFYIRSNTRPKYISYIVVQLSRKELSNYITLDPKKDDRGYHYSYSLIEATVMAFLIRYVNVKMRRDILFDMNYEENSIINSAANGVMWKATNGHPLSIKLFQTINYISSLEHEGRGANGMIWLSSPSNPNLDSVLELSRPVHIDDHSAVRKLLQATSNEFGLICELPYIYGHGKLKITNNEKREDLYYIRFTKQFHWELRCWNRIIMRVDKSRLKLPTNRLKKYEFSAIAKMTFNSISATQLNNLWQLVYRSTFQKKGTMIVISDGALEETNRLQKQSTLLKQMHLSPPIIDLVTAIDGAVLVDRNAICYAIGVILDGVASHKGKSSRGSRYNSAIRYVDTVKYPSVAVVISEDGFIDVISSYVPKLPRSLITDLLIILRKLTIKNIIDTTEYVRVMRLLSEHEYYLLPDICSEINELRIKAERLMDKSKRWPLLKYYDFMPNNINTEKELFID